MSDDAKKDDVAVADAPKEEAAPATETKEEEAKTAEGSSPDASSDEASKEEVNDSGIDESVEAKTSDAGSPDSSEEEFKVPKEFQALVDQVEKMTVLELHELVKVLEKRFGVSAAAVAVAGGGGGDAGGGEEQSEFTVELAEAGGSKIQVIKAVKEALGLGLKEAKDLVDGAPAEVKAGMKKEDAEELKTKLEEAGATVNLK